MRLQDFGQNVVEIPEFLGAISTELLSPEGLKLKVALEEIRKLKVQVDFLKKTMAYFVELLK
ncbi:MAG: hypothetical protein NTV34_10285 [Proteobacteria bacterium]|nr:hypothetical protein [Pseudomonadota bacterium]